MFSPTLMFRHFCYQLTIVSGSLFEFLRVFKTTLHTPLYRVMSSPATKSLEDRWGH